MSRPPDPPAVVFDCMIFLQAIANDESAAARALDLVESGEIKRDKDLLDLMTATDLESKQFRQRFRFLRIIDPAGLLREIKESAAGSE